MTIIRTIKDEDRRESYIVMDCSNRTKDCGLYFIKYLGWYQLGVIRYQLFIYIDPAVLNSYIGSRTIPIEDLGDWPFAMLKDITDKERSDLIVLGISLLVNAVAGNPVLRAAKEYITTELLLELSRES